MNDEKYDYENAVRNDILKYLEENEYGHIHEDEREALYNKLWYCDEVTGNASGSYTFSSWKAESYLCHNEDLREDCAKEFCVDTSDENHRGAEYWDVSIRCLLMGRLLRETVDKWNETHPEIED